MTSICFSMIPPSALISSTASSSESRTVCSLMAIGPEVEFRRPSVTVSPSTQVSPAGVPSAAVPVLAVSSSESLPQPVMASAETARMPIAFLALPRLMCSTPPHVTT
jgi:hypothetical protein